MNTFYSLHFLYFIQYPSTGHSIHKSFISSLHLLLSPFYYLFSPRRFRQRLQYIQTVEPNEETRLQLLQFGDGGAPEQPYAFLDNLLRKSVYGPSYCYRSFDSAAMVINAVKLHSMSLAGCKQASLKRFYAELEEIELAIPYLDFAGTYIRR
jgi:hypothetical protein